jgi:hypothetical protein
MVIGTLDFWYTMDDVKIMVMMMVGEMVVMVKWWRMMTVVGSDGHGGSDRE